MTAPIHTETFEGFDIAFYAEPEYDNPADHFASGDDAWDLETIEAIERGKLTWFCAKVTASKAGIELASDYLGGCCYWKESDFIETEGYYGDMRANVVAMARNVLAKLSEA